MAISALASLIQEAQDAFLRSNGLELTQGDIARRSGLSRQRISQFMTERVKTLPAPETIEMLAKGLRVSYDLVLRSALESAGYDVRGLFPASTPSDFTLAARRGRPRKTQGQDEEPL